MKNRKRFYLLYTLLFLCIGGLLAYFYYSQGRSLIDYKGDGFRQHYRAVLYTSNVIRQIFHNIFIEHSFAIPQWDFSLGEGSDILETLHYYGISDIILLPSALVPERYIYLYYDFAVFLRMYLAGLTFSGLCFYTGKKDLKALLCGTLIYSFSSYAFVTGTGHTFFLSAMVYLPMIITGVEKIFHRESGALFSVSVCLSSLSNVYFFYINVLTTVFYVIVRLICGKEEDKLNSFVRIAIYSVLGLLMSAVVVLPVASTMLGNNRLQTHFDIPLFFDMSEYRYLFTTFAFGQNGYFGGYTVVAVLVLTLLYRNRGRITLKILTLMSFVFISLPFFARLYNAMMYATNRWAYCISLLMAYIVTEVLDEDTQIKVIDLIPTFIYIVICILLDREDLKIYHVLLGLTLLMGLVLLFQKKLFKTSLLAVIVLSLAFTVTFHYSPLWWNYTRNGAELNEIEHNTWPDREILETIEDDSFWRYGSDSLLTNSSANTSYYSSQYYWSIANNNVIEARKELGLLDHNNHHYDNYNNRFLLNALSSTRYCIEHNDNDSHPYGFEEEGTFKNGTLYKSSYSLPLFYGYTQTVSLEEWLKLDLVNRQEVLSQAAVIENGQDPDLTFLSRDIPYEMSSSDVEFNGNEITVLNSSSYIDLTAQYPEAGEYYLVIEGFDSDKSTNWVVRNLEGKETIMFFKDDDHTGNADKHDFLINLGYYDGFDGTARILLLYPGIYSYKNMRLIYQPLEKQVEDLKELDCFDIKEFSVSNGVINAKLSADKDVLMCASIPYAKGWKLYLDGKETELKKVNLMYLGADLSAGEHTLELRYSTPFLKTGACVSLLSGIACLVLHIMYQKKRSVR